MDFIHDRLIDGRTVRILSVLDVHTRGCVALRAQANFRGENVGRVLGQVKSWRGLPPIISVDQGIEFTSRALDQWAYHNQVQLDFSRPGKPTDNAHVEAFHGSLRRELLTQYWWVDLAEVQRTLDAWREDYNSVRPHSGLSPSAPRPDTSVRAVHPDPREAPNLKLRVDRERGQPHVPEESHYNWISFRGSAHLLPSFHRLAPLASAYRATRRQHARRALRRRMGIRCKTAPVF